MPSSAQLAGPKQIRVRTLLDPNDLDLSKPSLEWSVRFFWGREDAIVL